MANNILIIDEDISYSNLLATALTLEGFKVWISFNFKEAIDILKKESIEILLLDTVIQANKNNDCIKKFKCEYPGMHIIMLSVYTDIRTCVQSIKNGAEDYLIKSPDISKFLPVLIDLINNAKQSNSIKPAAEQKRADSPFGFHNIIGNSEVIKEAITLAEKVTVTDATILLQGETGTGKELFANALHNASLRKKGPFLALNCSSLGKELLESELFGYRAGAFTGAIKDKKGILEQANGGTLFLDEIGELGLDVQAKLLRVLESGEFIKVGDIKTEKVDIRLISATHKDLAIEVKEKRFRQDLFYRLNIFSIKLPPLRERKLDIILLANYYIKLFSQKLGKHIAGMTKGYESLLMNYSWKGNIRELKNIIERSIILCDGVVLSEDNLPYEILSYSATVGREGSTSYSLSVYERLHIHKVLTTTKWNKIEAAKLLNISVSTLYRKIEGYFLFEEEQSLHLSKV